MPAKRVYLSLGSNLGDRRQNISAAIALIETEEIRVLQCSSIYETEPRDVVDQPWFLNVVLACETALFPRQLLTRTQQIERQLGRLRTGRVRGPRPIDIDILLFGRNQLATKDLTIPHPRMRERRFVLEPLIEINPDLRDPSNKELFSNYLANVREQRVTRLDTLCPATGGPR